MNPQTPTFVPDPSISQTPGFVADPSQAAAALGHSNSLVMNSLTSLSKGVAQSEVSTVGNIGTDIEKGLDATANLIPGVHANTAGQSAVTSANPALQPQNTLETIGNTVGDVGQFFIPGDAEEEVVAKGASLIDKIPQALGIVGEGAGAVTNALKVALKSAVSAGTFGGITAAQTNSAPDAAGGAILGVITGGISGVLDTFGKGLGEALQKADFKLSPAQEAKASSKVDSAAKFMVKNGITGSQTGKINKLFQLNGSLEGALQSSLPDSLGVPKSAVIDNINATVEQLKTEDPAIYNAAKSSADKAIDLMNTTKGDSVPVKDALKAKRSYGQAAFKASKFSVKDPNVVSEGSYAVEQGFQKALSDTLSQNNSKIKIPTTLSKYFDGAKEVSLQDFNKVYSDAITSKNFMNLAQFKNDSGLFGRLFGLWAGESIGQAVAPGLVGKVIGGGIGEVASQAIPGAVRSVGEKVASSPNVPTSIGKTIQGAENQ